MDGTVDEEEKRDWAQKCVNKMKNAQKATKPEQREGIALASVFNTKVMTTEKHPVEVWC